MKKNEINPRDIETWSLNSSSISGGGGSHPGNGNNLSGNGENGSGNEGGSGNGTTPPDPNWGLGGFSLDKENDNE